MQEIALRVVNMCGDDSGVAQGVTTAQAGEWKEEVDVHCRCLVLCVEGLPLTLWRGMSERFPPEVGRTKCQSISALRATWNSRDDDSRLPVDHPGHERLLPPSDVQ